MYPPLSLDYSNNIHVAETRSGYPKVCDIARYKSLYGHFPFPPALPPILARPPPSPGWVHSPVEFCVHLLLLDEEDEMLRQIVERRGCGQWKIKADELNVKMQPHYRQLAWAAITNGEPPAEYGRDGAQCLHRCAQAQRGC